jgi:hypothetical protein
MDKLLEELIEELVDEAMSIGMGAGSLTPSGQMAGYMGGGVMPVGSATRKKLEGDSGGLLTASPELHEHWGKNKNKPRGSGGNDISHIITTDVPEHKPFDLSMVGLGKNSGYANIVKIYMLAPDNVQQYWSKWYKTAWKQIKDLTEDYEKYGVNFFQVAAMAAVLSPSSSWELTLSVVDKLLRDSVTTGLRTRYANYGANVMKAWQILMNGADNPAAYVKGPKVYPFFLSIVDPEGTQKSIDRMVLDRHAINIWRGEPKRIEDTKLGSKAEMAKMRQDYIQAAKDLGISVSALQAVTWYVWQKAIKTAKYKGIEEAKKKGNRVILYDTIKEIVQQELMKQMGYNKVDGFKGNDVYVQQDGADNRSVGIIKQVCKNLRRPAYQLSKKPPLVGISIDEENN